MKFYGEVLILFLLLITNLRVFFVNHVRRDALTALSPFSLVISILQILSWDFDVFTTLTVLIALIVFLSNFHAIFRYSEKLYVDHYSTSMKIWAGITSIITTLTLIAAILFAPVEIKSEKIGVNEEITRYKGNFRTGFEIAPIYAFSDAYFHMFNKKTAQKSETPKEVILFIPDKRGDTLFYKPFLQLLAKENYTVCSGDFFADDLRWLHSFEDEKHIRRTASVFHSLYNNQKYTSQREFYTYNISRECETLLQFINKCFSPDTRIFLVSDVMGNTAISDFAKKHKDRVTGTFFLDSIPEYKTPGYGCIEQTDPLLAYYFGLKRDSKLTTPKLLANKTIQILEAANDTGTAE